MPYFIPDLRPDFRSYSAKKHPLAHSGKGALARGTGYLSACKSAGFCLTLLALSACASNELASETMQPERMHTAGAPSRPTDAYSQALCTGRTDLAAASASAALTAKQNTAQDSSQETVPATARDYFWLGYALHTSGLKLKARPALSAALQLAQPGETLLIECPGSASNPPELTSGPTSEPETPAQSVVLASGNVALLSQKLLAQTAKELRALGGTLPPETPLHAGLPSAAPANPQTASTSSAAVPSSVEPLTKPATLDPLGSWFVHFASYHTRENAALGIDYLGQQYPDFKGFFDNWQIDVEDKRTWRIGLRISDKQEGQKLCRALRARGVYCSLLDSRP